LPQNENQAQLRISGNSLVGRVRLALSDGLQRPENGTPGFMLCNRHPALDADPDSGGPAAFPSEQLFQK